MTTVFPLLLVLCSLAASAYFIHTQHTALFLYLVVAGLVIAIAGLHTSRLGTGAYLSPLPLVALLWAGYIAGNTLWLHPQPGWGLRQYYLTGSLLVFVALHAACRHAVAQGRPPGHGFYAGLTAIAGIVSLVCMAQAAGILPSQSTSFSVTGTGANPNTTAIFLAMAVPATCYCMYEMKGTGRKLAVGVLLTITIALVLLRCRTAWAGALLAALVLPAYRYRAVQWLKGRIARRGAAGWWLAAAAGLAMAIAVLAYRAKPPSADGRLLVWRISLAMVAKSPLTGCGYGNFERAYNLEQAAFFASGQGTAAAQWGAGHIQMAYNECIEHAAEGGIAGLLFFVLFILLLCRAGMPACRAATASVKETVTAPRVLLPGMTAFAAVLVFALMGMVNFSLSAIPVCAVLVTYAAILAALAPHPAGTVRIPAVWVKGLGMAGMAAGLVVAGAAVRQAGTQYQLKRALVLARTGNLPAAANLLDELGMAERHTENYYQLMARLELAHKNFAAALALYHAAGGYVSTPELYEQKGNCLSALAQYPLALAAYDTALYIQPNRFTPRVLKMQACMRMKDTAHALALAADILRLPVKIPSARITRYKAEAGAVLRSLQHNALLK